MNNTFVLINKFKENINMKFQIPKGSFCGGNCSDCLYANFYDTDIRGRVRCNGGYGGYNNPHDRNGCFYYKRK